MKGQEKEDLKEAGKLLETAASHPMAKIGTGLLLVKVLRLQQAILESLVHEQSGDLSDGG